MDSLKAMIMKLSALKIHFLAYITPESPYYASTISYGRDGPVRSTGDSIIVQLRALQDTFPYFHFYDFNMDGNHGYADSEAANYDHLCPAGAAVFSVRLDSIVHAILGE
jgi:hypothetical protein